MGGQKIVNRSAIEEMKKLDSITNNLIRGPLFDVDYLGGGSSNIPYFSPLPGEMIQFDSYFSNGLKPPTSYPP